MKEMFKILNVVTNTKEVTLILPVFAAKIMGRLTDIRGKITKKTGRMTSFAVYSLIRNNEFDCSKAAEELGFQTRPFRISITDTIDWLSREGKIMEKIGKAAYPETRWK